MSKPNQPTDPTLKPKDDPLDLLRRAEAGDATAVATLKGVFEDVEFVERTGNLARHAQDALVTKFSGRNLLLKEGLTRKLNALRTELSGPTPTPLERLLVERVVACWLHLHHLEYGFGSKDGMSLTLGTYYQRCLSFTQKRYLSAIKTLALVRKLAVPVLQVNIARRQVNVAGTVVGGLDDATGTPGK